MREWAPWLAAMIEGEGYVSPPTTPQRRVTVVTNQNVFVLAKTADILVDLGIEFSFRRAKDGTGSIMVYSKEKFHALWDFCGEFMVSWKQDNLRHLAHAPTFRGSRKCKQGCTCRRHLPHWQRRGAKEVMPHVP